MKGDKYFIGFGLFLKDKRKPFNASADRVIISLSDKSLVEWYNSHLVTEYVSRVNNETWIKCFAENTKLEWYYPTKTIYSLDNFGCGITQVMIPIRKLVNLPLSSFVENDIPEILKLMKEYYGEDLSF